MPARRLLAALAPVTVLPTAVTTLTITRGAAFTWPRDASDPLAGVAAVAATGAWAIACWWTLATASALLARVPGHLGRTADAVARRITPTAVRGLVAALSGAALAGSAAPAFAAAPPLPPAPGIALPVPTEPSSTPQSSTATSRIALPAPAEPGTPPRAPAAPPPREEALPRSHVRVVRAGDSLWSIAAHELGPHADPRAIARRWPDWWATNRALIGSDPAHLVPGEQLSVPTGSAA